MKKCYVCSLVLLAALLAAPTSEGIAEGVGEGEGEGEPEGPTAGFGFDVGQGQAPMPVQFTDVSDPGTSAITSWVWDFEDGVGTTDQNPFHVFIEPGTYTVSLNVTTEVGTSATTDTISVLEGEGRAEASGTVTDGSGQPLSCAALVFVASDDAVYVRATDLEGTYSFLTPTPDFFRVSVLAPGFMTFTDEIDLTSGVEQPANYALIQRAAGTAVGGQVRVENTEIHLSGIRVEAWNFTGFLAATYTCADGHFEFFGLKSSKQGPATLKFIGEGFFQETTAAFDGLDVELRPKSFVPGSILGAVVTAETSSPIEAARVAVQPFTSGLGFSVRTAGDGLYSVSNLPDDWYIVRATSSRYRERGIDARTLLSGEQTIRLDFKFAGPPDVAEGVGEGGAEGGGEGGGEGAVEQEGVGERGGGCSAASHEKGMPGDFLFLALIGAVLLASGRRNRQPSETLRE